MTTSSAGGFGEPELFVWTCTNFSKKEDTCYSPEWATSRNCRWRLLMYKRGRSPNDRSLSLYLQVPFHLRLPLGWRRAVHFTFRVANQNDRRFDYEVESSSSSSSSSQQCIFKHNATEHGFSHFLNLVQLHDPSYGFLVDDTLIVEVRVTVRRLFVDPARHLKAINRVAEDVELNSLVDEAASNGDVLALRRALASHPHLIDGENPMRDDRTPMHAAAASGHTEAIRLLVERGSYSLEALDSMFQMPVNLAVANGHLQAIDTLLQFGGYAYRTDHQSEKLRTSPMQTAVSIGRLDLIRHLVRLQGESLDLPGCDGQTPMLTAAKKGQVEAIEELVRLGSKAIDTPDRNGQTPLHCAAEFGRVAVLETLVRLGSNAIDTPNGKGMTPIYAAAQKGHVDVIEKLVQLGSRAIDTPTHAGDTVMHAAVHCTEPSRIVDVIGALIRLGCTALDSPDKDGRTPLSFAAEKGEPDIIEALIRYGSRAIDTFDHKRQTPLYHSIAQRSPDVVETLVRLGSKAIDVPALSGKTPIREAFQSPAHGLCRCRGGGCKFCTLAFRPAQVLLALGAVFQPQSSSDRLRAATHKPSEEDVLDTRYRVYFAHSFVYRLLLDLERSAKNQTRRLRS